MTNLNVTQVSVKTDADKFSEVRALQSLCLGVLTLAENGATIDEITPLLDRLYNQSLMLSKVIVTL